MYFEVNCSPEHSKVLPNNVDMEPCDHYIYRPIHLKSKCIFHTQKKAQHKLFYPSVF